MTKSDNSKDLINNLLLNLDNLQTLSENKTNVQKANDSIQDQLESLRIETAKITCKYTRSSPTKSKSKKIPPPIITCKTPMHSQLQTIDDMLLELNNISGGNKTPSSKSAKGRKFPNSFVDPRRFSDPYKYTILSTLNESEDGEEEDEFTPQTPKTALPYYSRRKDYKNLTYTGHNIPNISSYSRNRSNSQPERYTVPKKNIPSSALHKSASIGYEMNTLNTMSPMSTMNMERKTMSLDRKGTSMDYYNKLKTSNENMNKPRKIKELVVKPPRTSSMFYNYGKYNLKPVRRNSDNSDSDPYSEQNFNQYQAGDIQMIKQKNYLGLENKSSFQSDITLVNEE